MKEENENKGFLLSQEYADRKTTDFLLGASGLTCIAEIPNDDRIKYIPKGERQNIGEEKMDCVARAFNNSLETKFLYLLKNNLLPDTHVKFLKENGYITANGVEFSDAFIAILSGTTRQGNSLIRPIDTIHKVGLVPKNRLPQLDSFEAYHNPARIVPTIKKLGMKFLEYFAVSYERLSSDEFVEFMQRDSCVVGGYAWPTPVNGVYPRVNKAPTHAFLNLYLPAFNIFDNYEEIPDDYIKTLAADFSLTDFGYRVIVSLKHPPLPPEEMPIQTTLLALLKQLLYWLRLRKY